MNVRPYFIGVSLPTKVSDRLFAFKWKIHDETEHALKPLVPHITLLHPSSLQDVVPDDILPKISEVARAHVPLSLTLVTVSHFSHEVLYLSVESAQLSELQQKLVALLPASAQDPYRRRSYTPHVTLAQVRSPRTLAIDTLIRSVDQEIELPFGFTATNLTCFTQVQPREYSAQAIR